MLGELSPERAVTGHAHGSYRPRRFGGRAQSPLRRFGGIALVLALHAALIYGLLNGLASQVVAVIQQPIEARLIAPVKPPPPPPPPPVVKLAPPKVAPPPRPFVAPPEVPVVSTPSTVSIQSTPVAPTNPTPAPVAAPAPATKPVNREVGVVCPNSDQVRASLRYPREALENNITGDVLVEFSVDTDGRVSGERVMRSADPVLDRAALNAVRRFSCISQGQSVRVQVPFSFNLN
ncbi:energy transducer TonB [Pandoraea sp. NPDC090278]|uniref:energy transducer TonB n=1 Tax=Pandoraea sp. NPDC090278 TaxID=3364391 RepID=UPI00383AFB91